MFNMHKTPGPVYFTIKEKVEGKERRKEEEEVTKPLLSISLNSYY